MVSNSQDYRQGGAPSGGADDGYFGFQVLGFQIFSKETRLSMRGFSGNTCQNFIRFDWSKDF